MRAALLIACAALAVPGLALAQTATSGKGRLDIVGVAPSACLVAAAPSASGSNAAVTASTTRSAEIRITQLVDPLTAQARPSSINLALPIICNMGHRVIVRTTNGGMSREGPAAPAAGFRELLPYGVTASWAGATASGDSQTSPTLNIINNEGAAGDLSIDIVIPGGGLPLVAGTYSDQLVIELQVAS